MRQNVREPRRVAGRRKLEAGGAESRRSRKTAGGVAAEVKSRLNIVDVVGETVQLKKAGTTFKGLCPFHGEKTPSFTVTPSRDSWKCFGCGLGGDVFCFVMQRDGVAFPEALRTLAAKAGVEIDERTKREDAHRARLRDVLETAIAFYHQVLTSTNARQAGARLPARPRLHRRDHRDVPARLGARGLGLDEPQARREARHQARRARRGRARLAGALHVARRRRHRQVPRPRPVPDPRPERRARPGMGGRILGSEGEGGRDTGPKYLNTPGTPLFDKSRSLYLIDKAKGAMRKSGQAVIVEGYTDALMAHQAGFDNVVASLGHGAHAGPGRAR